MTKLPARTGIDWLKQGFALFRQQPGILTMLVFANFLIAILLSTLPLLGPILSFVLIPSFTMGIQQCCYLIDDGKKVMPGVLLTGFRKGALGPLCKLGMVYFGILVLMILVVSPWIDIDSVRNAATMAEAKQAPALDASTKYAVLAFVIMLGVAFMALSFAPGLTYWKRMPTFKAIFYSFFAVMGALRALLAMMFTGLGIYWLLGMIIGVTLGRGQFVLVLLAWLNLILALVLQCGIYCAYKQILGMPQSEPAVLA